MANGEAGAPPPVLLVAPQRYAQPRPNVPAPRLASPVGLSWAVVALLGLCVLADVFSLYAGSTMFGLVDRWIGGDEPYEFQADHADLLQLVSGIAQAAAVLATAVVFIIWFRRVRINAEVFRPDGHRMRRGWAVWGWIVPVVNVWFPKRIANDIWSASLPHEPDGSPRRVPRTLMNWWWGLLIAAFTLGRTGGRMYSRAETLEEVRRAVEVLFVADAVDIVAAVVAMLFVRRLTALQDEKAHQGPVLPPPAPPFREPAAV
ncbi:DUF4328 domain-containing protein [Streptomyces sp. I05A-00742]|uniref:DUF4328 domain-containing protein n=1 Tax=Streptomyces sp. I05A-00742 TaxID=2732853 RepID=UPI0028983A63|nr:DUF4328 domain-containing protein [Streptomyces sp. I05A-00742]